MRSRKFYGRAKTVRLRRLRISLGAFQPASSTGKPGSRLLNLVRLMIWEIDLICCSIWIPLRHLRPSSKKKPPVGRPICLECWAAMMR